MNHSVAKHFERIRAEVAGAVVGGGRGGSNCRYRRYRARSAVDRGVEHGGCHHAHAMRGAVPYEGAQLPVCFELAYPEQATDATIEDVDMVLDQIAVLDELGKQTVKSKLGEPRSSASQFYRAWESRHPFGEASVDAFIAALRPGHIDIQPDGGREQPDRVTLKYGLADSPVTSTLDVRYLEPTGPELAPAPFGGYREFASAPWVMRPTARFAGSIF